MPPPSLIIFDCDGVLVDSEYISHHLIVEMLAEHSVSITFEEAVDLFIGSSNTGLLEKVQTLCGGSVPEYFLERFRERMFAAFESGLEAVSGIEAVLESLAVPFCVASNGRHAKMRVSLGKTGLLRHFAGRMFSADDVNHPKPAPDLFLHAARTHGVDPADCAVIEDTPTGIRAARAAGMRAFGYAAMTRPERLLEAGAHAVFQRMEELPALLLTTPGSCRTYRE